MQPAVVGECDQRTSHPRHLRSHRDDGVVRIGRRNVEQVIASATIAFRGGKAVRAHADYRRQIAQHDTTDLPAKRALTLDFCPADEPDEGQVLSDRAKVGV